MAPDPYARYLEQADQLFAAGEVVRAGQIWQAILKQVPDHAVARENLMKLRVWLEAQHAAEARPVPAPVPSASFAQDAEPTPKEVPVVREDTLYEAPPTAPLSEPAPPGLAPIPAAAPAAALTAVPAASSEDIDRMLREGCTLYDMGQVEDALLKWEALLRLEPTHQLTREYVASARRDLGLPPLGDGAIPPPAPAAAAAVAAQPEVSQEAIEEAEKLLREGCLLWDMGLNDEAKAKWRKALEFAPHRMDIHHFLEDAEREEVSATQALHPSQMPRTPSDGAVPAAQEYDETVETKLKQAEHLMGLLRFDEAAYTLIQAERLAPHDPRIQEALRRSRAHEAPPSAASVSATTALPPASGSVRRPGPGVTVEVDQEAFERTSPGFSAPTLVNKEPSGPQAVEPPAALTRATAPARTGITLQTPRILDQLQGFDWIKDPKVWVLTGAAGLVLIVGGMVIHSFRKDAQLKADVQAARAQALRQAAAEAQVTNLALSRAEILDEARQALSDDPVRAYLRIQYLLRQNPGDGEAAQLQGKAVAAMSSGGVAGASEAEYQRLLADGNLDAAHKVMDALLRLKPEDATLRTRAARLERALAEDHAAQGHLDDARLDLMRARALQPDDLVWQAKLKLLDQLRSMPKSQRQAWTSLLG
ncbi:MAG TPA: hypothetical protein VJ600_09645 [Holophagaceae bacterium]|nr:hypothetical protein [Holophagaceae bacterium]